MTPDEKAAVHTTATELQPAVLHLLWLLLFRLAPRGEAEVRGMARDDIARRTGIPRTTLGAWLKALENGCYLEVIRHAPHAVEGWSHPYRQPNTYRLLTVAQRHAALLEREAEREAARAAEETEIEFVTVDMSVGIGPTDSSEESTPTSCTPAVREAARAFWLPLLPPLPGEARRIEQEGEAPTGQLAPPMVRFRTLWMKKFSGRQQDSSNPIDCSAEEEVPNRLERSLLVET